MFRLGALLLLSGCSLFYGDDNFFAAADVTLTAVEPASIAEGELDVLLAVETEGAPPNAVLRFRWRDAADFPLPEVNPDLVRSQDGTLFAQSMDLPVLTDLAAGETAILQAVLAIPTDDGDFEHVAEIEVNGLDEAILECGVNGPCDCLTSPNACEVDAAAMASRYSRITVNEFQIHLVGADAIRVEASNEILFSASTFMIGGANGVLPGPGGCSVADSRPLCAELKGQAGSGQWGGDGGDSAQKGGGGAKPSGQLVRGNAQDTVLANPMLPGLAQAPGAGGLGATSAPEPAPMPGAGGGVVELIAGRFDIPGFVAIFVSGGFGQAAVGCASPGDKGGAGGGAGGHVYLSTLRPIGNIGNLRVDALAGPGGGGTGTNPVDEPNCSRGGWGAGGTIRQDSPNSLGADLLPLFGQVACALPDTNYCQQVQERARALPIRGPRIVSPQTFSGVVEIAFVADVDREYEIYLDGELIREAYAILDLTGVQFNADTGVHEVCVVYDSELGLEVESNRDCKRIAVVE